MRNFKIFLCENHSHHAKSIEECDFFDIDHRDGDRNDDGSNPTTGHLDLDDLHYDEDSTTFNTHERRKIRASYDECYTNNFE